MTSDAWSSAEAYEPFIGRWSRLVAHDIVEWLDPPPGLRWLDVGCGTGALSAAVLAGAAPASVVGVDPSQAYVGQAAARLDDRRASFQAGDAGALPLPDSSVDRVVCGLVLNFVPDAVAAVREMRRVLVPGGIATAHVWDYAGGMQMLRYFWDAAIADDPAAVASDEGRRFPVCRPGGLEICFASGGMSDLQARRSWYPPRSATSTTTGVRSSAARGPALATVRRSRTTSGNDCVRGCRPSCRRARTDRSG